MGTALAKGNKTTMRRDSKDPFLTSIRAPESKQPRSWRLYKGFLQSKAPDTQSRYIEAILLWVSFLRTQFNMTIKTPDDLLMARKADKIEERIKDFIIWQKGLGLSYSLINLRHWAIRKFYVHNGIICNWDLIVDMMPKNEKKNKDLRAYRLEEIQRMLHLADLRIRAILTLLATSGLRIGALEALNKGSLTKIDKFGIYMVKAYEGASEQFVTFASQEFTKAIEEYFADRERAGETITDDSPLFITEYDRIAGIQKVTRLKTSSIEGVIYRHLVKNGFRSKKPVEDPSRKGAFRHEVQLSYGLRKWFKKMLRRAKVDSLIIEYLMNHKKGDAKAGITELEMIYDPAEEYELLEEYAKALDNLVIDPVYHEKRKAQSLQKSLDHVNTVQQKAIELLQAKLDRLEKNGTLTQPAEPRHYVEGVSRYQPAAYQPGEVKYVQDLEAYNKQEGQEDMLQDTLSKLPKQKQQTAPEIKAAA